MADVPADRLRDTLARVVALLDASGARAIPAGFGLDAQWREWNPLLRGLHARLTREAVIVDVMRPRDEHEETALGRRRRVAFGAGALWVVAPDDLVLMKLKVGRPHDFEDAVAVLAGQPDAIDEPYMTGWAERLGIADQLSYVMRHGGPA